MGNIRKKETPIIMVKNVTLLALPYLKNRCYRTFETVKMEDQNLWGSSSPAVDTHPLKLLPVRKRRRFPRQPHWTHEFTHSAGKVKSLFPIFAQKASFFH
nr:hypothetical protein [Escherichia coli]